MPNLEVPLQDNRPDHVRCALWSALKAHTAQSGIVCAPTAAAKAARANADHVANRIVLLGGTEEFSV